MDTRTIVVIISAIVAVAAVFYTRSLKSEAMANDKGLSGGQAMGAGVVGLGLLGLVMPWASGQIAALDFIQSSDFAILTGATYVVGLITVLAGVAVFMGKGNDA